MSARAFASAVAKPRHHLDECGTLRDTLGKLGCLRIYARPAHIEQVDTHLIRRDQRDPAIDAAVDEEIAGQRNDMFGRATHRRLGVVGFHRDDIRRPRFPLRGDIETEAAERALVLADMHAVDPDIGNRADCGEIEIVALVAGGWRGVIGQPIPAHALRVVCPRRALFGIFADAVPGMRDRDLLPAAVVEARRSGTFSGLAILEAPALGEIGGLANLFGSGRRSSGRRSSGRLGQRWCRPGQQQTYREDQFAHDEPLD